MSSKRYLPQVPSQTTMATITTTTTAATHPSQLTSRSAIEDLFHVFENSPEFITMGKRLLNKKRKLEQLRAQLNLPDQLTNEDTVKLLKLRERLKAKRRLRKISLVVRPSITCFRVFFCFSLFQQLFRSNPNSHRCLINRE